MSKQTYELSDEQCESILSLINKEIASNKANGDEAYNTHWINIKFALGYAHVS